MALHVVVCLRDRVAELYHQPWCVPTVGVGLRRLADEVNGKESSPLRDHPEDFELFELGTFEDTTCRFVLKEQPGLVLTLSALVNVRTV